MNKIEFGIKISKIFDSLIVLTEGNYRNVFEFTLNNIIFYVSTHAISFPIINNNKPVIVFQKIDISDKEYFYFLTDEIHKQSLSFLSAIDIGDYNIKRKRFFNQIFDTCNYFFNDMNEFLNDLYMVQLKCL